LVIVSSAPIIQKRNKIFAYAPYADELKYWNLNSDLIEIACPTGFNRPLLLKEIEITPEIIELKTMDFISFKSGFISMLNLPINVIRLYRSFFKTDHIHLRCPGNIGLLGCFVQILFPKTPKTVKYAGNWDPKAKQPLSYRLQKWILSNTFLTRNTKVLVYGDWPNQSKNIKSFFTATYSEEMIKIKVPQRQWDGPLEFLFVGTLSRGKRPTYALELIRQLLKQLDCKEGEIFKGHSTTLRTLRLKYFGDGPEREVLEEMIIQNELQDCVTLMGNVNSEELINAYQESHFLILPSQSEGWPKAVAEAMFWGAIPLVTPISCVPWIIDHGQRGQLLSLDLVCDANEIISLIEDSDLCQKKSHLGAYWARQYTTERFAQEIKQLF